MGATRKSEKTRKKIKEVFISLAYSNLGTIPNVCEICSELDIYRSTFYNYYSSIEELIAEISEERKNDILKHSDRIPELDKLYRDNVIDYVEVIRKILVVLYNNRREYVVLFCPKNACPFQAEMNEILRKCISISLTEGREAEQRCVSIYISHGIYAAIYYWLKEENIPLDRFVVILSAQILNGIQAYNASQV